MARIVLLMSFVVVLACCKNSKGPDPLPEVAGIVGKWRMTENIVVRGDSTVVETLSKENAYVVGFRFDGTATNERGQRLCCEPSSYILNGVPFVIKTIGTPPAGDPGCASVRCAGCAEWILTQKGDHLTIESCYSMKANYVREK
jgi:hypothetical protein